jgi:archaeosortase B (VPXXXP-CTERM-specific)
MSVRISPVSVNQNMIKMLAIFLFVIASGITYLLHPASRVLQEPLERFLAMTTGTFLSWFNATVWINQTTINVEQFTANIVPACTGLFTITIFIAAVLAYPCSLRQKAMGVFFGVLAILTLNWIRIVSLLLIGAYWPNAFDFAHLVVWQSVAIVFAVVAWLFWVQKVVYAR